MAHEKTSQYRERFQATTLIFRGRDAHPHRPRQILVVLSRGIGERQRMIEKYDDTGLLGWTIHGGRIADAQAAFPDAPRPWLDLSTGINPDPWPGTSALKIDWQSLPDEGALRLLERTAGDYFGVDSADVLALPGTEFGLRHLGALDLPPPYRHLSPGYRTHGEALPGSMPIAFDALMAEAQKGGTILLANPANPDGQLIEPATLRAVAGVLAQNGGWLVLDEAFIDAHDDGTIAPLLSGDEPVIILRSFGKFFGLAGVRLGFAVGPAAIIAQWRARIGSWPISAAAIAIGTAAYADAEWIAATRLALPARAASLDAVLRAHGLTPTGASPLFRLIECDGHRLFQRLARRGILTRPFDYAPRWLRLGVPVRTEDLARLDEALRDG